MDARQLFLSSALALCLVAPATTVMAGEGCGKEACKDFAFTEARQIGAWTILTGGHAGRAEKEYAAFNTAQGVPDAGFSFSCGDGPVAYALMDGQPHAPGQKYKVTFTLDKMPPETLDGEATGDFGAISVAAGTHLIEAISNARTFKVKATGHGKSREFTFTNDSGRAALLTWGRACGIHD